MECMKRGIVASALVLAGNGVLLGCHRVQPHPAVAPKTEPTAPPAGIGANTGLVGAVDRAAFCAAHAIQASGLDPLIEDIEDGDRQIRAADGRSGRWWLTHDDGCQVTAKDPAPAAPGGNDSSQFAIRGGVRDCKGWGFALGFALNSTGNGLCAYDVSRYDGVYFWARSGQANATIRFRVGTRQTWPAKEGGDGTCDPQPNGCWDDYAVDVTLGPTWTLYSATWSQLAQKGWGKATAFNVHDVNSLTWSSDANPTDYREIWVDQVGFFKGAPPTTRP